MNTEQVTIVVVIRPKDGMWDEVRTRLLALAEETRSEPGNMGYILHEAVEDKQLIIYENWRDSSALDSHMAEPYLKAFLEEEDRLLREPIAGTICRII